MSYLYELSNSFPFEGFPLALIYFLIAVIWLKRCLFGFLFARTSVRSIP